MDGRADPALASALLGTLRQPRPIASWAAFERGLLDVVDASALAGARELWLCDPDFAQWPLGRAEVVAAFARWAAPRRRLRLLAADYAGFAERFPRWMAWRRDWAHVVECLVLPPDAAPALPTVALGRDVLLAQLHDGVHGRGRVASAPLDLARAAQQLHAVSQRAEPALPVTTLGL